MKTQDAWWWYRFFHCTISPETLLNPVVQLPVGIESGNDGQTSVRHGQAAGGQTPVGRRSFSVARSTGIDCSVGDTDIRYRSLVSFLVIFLVWALQFEVLIILVQIISYCIVYVLQFEITFTVSSEKYWWR